jgi:hypothetical protein
MSKTLRKKDSTASFATRTDDSEYLLSPVSVANRAPSITTDIPPLDFSSLHENESYSGSVLVESPIDEVEEMPDDVVLQRMMLPPTVSTYQHKSKDVAPLPHMNTLRSDLTSGLGEVRKMLASQDEDNEEPSQGWAEVQGMHTLDVVTQALRAAKMYYTAHEQPARLAAIKSEREMRRELIEVMDLLKRMATRSFAGGIKDEERQSLSNWVDSCEQLLEEEQRREQAEAEERRRWEWANGEWIGPERELEREYLFLRCFDPEPETLPEWKPLPESDGQLPTAFLQEMQSGVRLVRLHNAILKASRRNFGAIPVYHEDTAKPYRAAENLRFWLKAAELRWEVLLKVDVMGVVYGSSEAAWREFDLAIRSWCRKLREELCTEPQETRRGTV